MLAEVTDVTAYIVDIVEAYAWFSFATHSDDANGSSSQTLWPASSCRWALAYAEARDYAGYSKFDALNSPVLHSLAANNRLLRLIYTRKP